MLFISFTLFHTFSLRQHTINFERCLLSPEHSLFTLKGCFSLLWILCLCACCRNDNVTSYDGPQKFNPLRRYFNQIYSDKLLSKLIINLAKKSLFSILAILAQIITQHSKKFSEISFQLVSNQAADDSRGGSWAE